MRKNCLIISILILAVLAVFGPAARYDFVGWDDDIHVYNNPYLKPPTVESTIRFWEGPYEGLYIPATFSLWAGLTKVSGALEGEEVFKPFVYHGANIILHLLNVLLVYSILALLLEGEGGGRARVAWAAGAGALLYGLHPIQVEPVVWVSSMKDLLCGFFSLLAIREYLVYAKGLCVTDWGEEHRVVRVRPAAVGTVAFVLALLAKPAAVPVPVIAWLLLHFRCRNRDFDLQKSIRSFFEAPHMLLVVWVLLSTPIIFLAKFSEKEIPLGFVAPLWARLPVALDAIGFFLGKLLVPFNLGIDYGRTPELVMEEGWFHCTWIFPVALAVFLVFLKDRKRWLAAFGVFVAGVLPVIGLVPHGYQVFSTVADRFLYLALLGPALAFGWLFVSRRYKTIIIFCAVFLCLIGALSIRQRMGWADNVKLFEHALEVNPRSYMAHYNLGLTLSDREDRSEAVEHYRKALAIKPDYGRAHNNLGAVLTEMGRLEESIPHYAAAFRLNPGDVRAYFNLYSAYNQMGIELADRGDLEGAVAHYRKALAINPAYADAVNNLGNALAAAGDRKAAIVHYRKALKIKPDYPMALNNLGVALAGEGKLTEAIEYFSKALLIDPSFPNARINLERAVEARKAKETTGSTEKK